MATFADLTRQDFECPQGKPWVKSKVKIAADGRVYVDGRECRTCGKKREEVAHETHEKDTKGEPT